MTLLRASMIAAIASCGLLAGCSTAPITVSSTSTTLFPPGSGGIAVAAEPVATGPSPVQAASDRFRPCSVRLADVRDTRSDPNDLGMMGLRDVRTSDSIAWVRTSLEHLKQDRRLTIVDDDNNAEFVLKVELVKAYIMTMNTQKSANVVLRVAYTRQGKDLDSQIARGRDTGSNWANGEGEAQGALNRALSAAVSQLDDEIVEHCHALDSEKPT